jgi:hypothetical protein
MTHFAQHHPFYAGVIGMLFAGGLAFAGGVIAPHVYWNWRRIVSALRGRGV